MKDLRNFLLFIFLFLSLASSFSILKAAERVKKSKVLSDKATKPVSNFKIPNALKKKQWEIPTYSDIIGEWKTNLKENPSPYHVHADFDGNGLKDDAWILFNRNLPGWGLFIFTKHKNKPVKYHKIETTQTLVAQSYAIAILEPKKHKTACGKGYFKCEDNEPEEINIKNPGINFYKYESVNRMVYWDASKDKFITVWESD